MLRGDDQFEGTLSLDEDYLFFRSVPTGPGKRPLAWELPRRVVDTVTLSDDMLRLDLVVGAVTHRFEGNEFDPLFAALQPARVGLITGSFKIPDLGDSDPVLLEGAVNLFVNNLVSARGQLTLTETEISFEPREGLETAVWKNLGKTIRLDAIDDVDVVGIRRQVVISAGPERLVLGGSLAPRVYGILLCLRGDTVTLSPHEVLFTWTVSLLRGPVAIAGELIGSWRRMRFLPTGRIDALFGLDDEIAMRMNEVTRVEVRGRLERRLVISGGGEELSFDVPDPAERFEELKDFLVQLDHESEPCLPAAGATESDPEIDELVEDWKTRLPFLESSSMHLLGGVLDVSRPDRARRGWLGLFGERIVFLPIGGAAGGEPPLVVPADDVSRATQGSAPAEHLYLGVAGTTLRFLARGGDSFAANFWSLWQPLVERTPAGAPQPRDRSTGFGDAGTFNRRDAYRVTVPGRTRVGVATTHTGADDPLDAMFVDLAPEGCALVLDSELAADSDVHIQLPDWLIDDSPGGVLDAATSGSFAVPCGPVPAQLVYSQQLRGSRWRHGFQFADLDREQDQWVRSLYMSLQRDEVNQARQDWGEPGGAQAPVPSSTILPSE
jgi:hypothetical protein